ncbi:unnamed protein product [Debaryomyces tyrocola]|nr:unnamed protein product [Debaryomyces tyrocola]
MQERYKIICEKEDNLIKQYMLTDFEFAVWYLKN